MVESFFQKNYKDLASKFAKKKNVSQMLLLQVSDFFFQNTKEWLFLVTKRNTGLEYLKNCLKQVSDFVLKLKLAVYSKRVAPCIAVSWGGIKIPGQPFVSEY